MSAAEQGVHPVTQPMQLRRHERIHEPTIPQVRIVADLLRERGEQLALEAAKRREVIRKQARSGTPAHVTDARNRQADDIDDQAAESFALADWIERQGRNEP